MSLTIIDLHGDDATKEKIFETIQTYHPQRAIMAGHGNSTTYTAQRQEVVLKTCENDEIMSGTLSHFISCSVGQQLLPSIIKKGGVGTIGYIVDFTFMINTDYSVEKDPYAEPFKDVTVTIITKMLQGATLQQVWQAGVDKCNEWIVKLKDKPEIDWGEVIACLPPDEEIVCNPIIKPIANIKVGDLVLTHLGRFQRVQKTFVRHYDGKLIKILPTYSNIPILVTPEHPVLVAESILCPHKYDVNGICKPRKNKLCQNCRVKHWKEYRPTWKEAQRIEHKDLLVYPIVTKTIDIKSINLLDYYTSPSVKRYKENGEFLVYRHVKVPKNILINDDFMELAGYYVSEGCTQNWRGTGNCTFSLSFDNREKYNIQRVKHLVKSVFGLNIHIDKEKNHVILRANCRPIAEFLEKLFGKGAHNKHLPDWFLYIPTKKQKALLKGLINGDGYDTPTGFAYTTVSTLLASQVKAMLLRLKVPAAIYKKENKGGTVIKNKSLRWAYCIYGFSKWKIARNGWTNGNFFFVPVRKIEIKEYNGDVHNLEVERDNSFVSLNASLHNCLEHDRDGLVAFGDKSARVLGGTVMFVRPDWGDTAMQYASYWSGAAIGAIVSPRPALTLPPLFWLATLFLFLTGRKLPGV